ncbi:hypothetical protein BDZ89DRAFT_1063935 [Hymenopellis radicata]|nr:hypothetical protein BDZ89DRAFT_1063935 [Hymenopellis radicata]
MIVLYAFSALFGIATVTGWHFLRRHLLSVETGSNDLRSLGIARKRKIPGTAVVCGGSIGGLLTARACHDHFERVIVIEPEAWLSTEEGRLVQSWTQTQTRSRLIQYHSLHASLACLYYGLLRLFPNLAQECMASGIGIAPADFKSNFWGQYLRVPYEEYLGDLPKTLFASRRAIETLIRRLTLNSTAFPDIQQITGTVVGVTRDPSAPGYLRQVKVRTQDGELDIDAALVIDCTGSARAGIKWIQRAGFGSTHHPEGLSLARITDTFDGQMHYSTIRCVVSTSLAERLPIPGGFQNVGGCILSLTPDMHVQTRYFASMKLEGNSVLLCCGGWGSRDLPVNLAGVREYVASIHVTRPLPDWFWTFLEMMSEVEDTLTCSAVTAPASYWTHFENVPDLPSNWIAIGDSVSRVNPIYGHGCPKILLGVLAMNSLLHEASPKGDTKTSVLPANFSQRFFKKQARRIQTLWNITKTIDYGLPATIPMQGETLAVGSFQRWLMRQLQLLSVEDSQAGSVVWHSQMMLNNTSIDALHPVLLGKILWFAFKHRYLVTKAT